MARKSFTPEERQAYIESKQRQREELETRVKDLVNSFRDSDTFKSYLSQMSEFNRRCGKYLHHYSPNNLLFIVMQDPNAQLVGSASAWRKVGRHISKGETSRIQVWAPMREAVMQNKLDENGNPILKPDGTPEREPIRDDNGRVMRRFKGHFKLEPVFDISQTDGDPLPELVSELKDPVEHFADYETALREISPFPIFYSDEQEAAGVPLGDAKGVCAYFAQKIVIKAGMPEMQTLIVKPLFQNDAPLKRGIRHPHSSVDRLHNSELMSKHGSFGRNNRDVDSVKKKASVCLFVAF